MNPFVRIVSGRSALVSGCATRLVLGLMWLSIAGALTAGTLPPNDLRLRGPKDLNSLWRFPEVKTGSAWETRAREIREQILVRCGLWPLPEKTPLAARISGRIERDGYSVEKVYLQTYPGFYLGGNLYRPLNRGPGPFPGVLNPHGHWSNGRLADTADGSVAARCIQFARLGMVAFSYDMVGYNDTVQVSHRFASDPTNQLWQISLMGLQTWNSIRALDFLESLPEVDPKRLACTGESGGGTQTFMLGAVDSRLAAQAPVVMVSHSMQGGCLCENAPGLRLDFSNMEIAAAAAPRPQLLVAATGDWTKDTLEVEGPGIESIYRLFQASDRFRYVRFDFGHNYNQTSREAVYASFAEWLLGRPRGPITEAPYRKEPDADLRVWPEGTPPADALNEERLIGSLIERWRQEWAALRPTDEAVLRRFQRLMRPAWRHTLAVDLPENDLVAEVGSVERNSAHTVTRVHLGREGKGDRVPALLLSPAKENLQYLVVLIHPEGKRAYAGAGGAVSGLAARILERNQSVLLVDPFLTGEPERQEAERKPFERFFTTYNRTDLQERVQDVLTACLFAQRHGKGRRIVLCGVGRAGLWALLAAPAADAVVADCAGLDTASDSALLEPDLFVPGLRRLGGWEGVAALAAPHPLYLHGTGERFSTDWLRDCYAAVKSGAFRQETSRATDEAIVAWIKSVAAR